MTSARTPSQGHPARPALLARNLGILTLVLALASCGTIRDSRINPLNWFGRDRAVAVVTPDATPATEPLAPQVLSLRVDRMPGGAIVTAVALPPTQGFWDAELVALNDGRPERGVLSYEFRLKPPATPQRVSTQVSREVVVATSLTDQQLAGVGTIEVIGATNRRSVRR